MITRTPAQQRDDALLKELNNLLHARHVYSITAMGWLDEDTPDPDFMGLNIWATSPPVQWNYGFNVYDGIAINPDQAELWQQSLAIACSDFEGLMVAARMSIGMTLRHSDAITENQFGDDTFYSLNRMNALTHLSAASERIRDVFIGGVLKTTRQEFEGDTRGRKKYCAPIAEAERAHPDQSADWKAELTRLESLCMEVVGIRRTRNDVVHRLATRSGRNEERFIKNWTQDDGSRKPSMPHAEIVAAYRAMEEQHRATIEGEIDELIRWYDLLTRVANSVFLCEYGVRSAK